MASASPSPNSSPSAVSPGTSNSGNTPPPTVPTSSSPPPTSSQNPNATSAPPSTTPTTPSTNSSSPPPTVPSTPPPTPLPTPSPPPPVQTPVPPTSPPLLPLPPSAQPVLPTPPPAPLPNVPSPPPPVSSSPPPSTPDNSPPPPVSHSPPTNNSPPPSVSHSPPANNSPPPKPGPSPPSPSVSQPPPADSPPPLPSASPPPPVSDPPKSSPSPPTLTPPPSLPPNSPTTPLSPPPNEPNPTPPGSQSPPPPQSNSSFSGSTTPLSPEPFPTRPPPEQSGGLPGVPNSVQPENANSTGNKGIQTGGAVAIGIVVGFLVLSLIGIALWYVRKRKKKITGYNAGHVMPSPLGSSPDTYHIKAHSSSPLISSASGSGFIYSPPEPGGLGNSRSWFTYEELIEATNGFSVQNLLGEGGFGCVYKGYLSDGREVAVKQLKIGGSQGEREFRAEVETISRIHHRHLVSLVGYCISDHQRLLVYDYVPNNTLHYHLHDEVRVLMDWATRVKVAAGAARGIAYLHEDCHPRIIHRDIKSSNILLDGNFEAQVSDFGLAKLALDAYTHVTTRVMGTFGYMAPEYASSGKLTEKSDVYSFGVVLLELITGRKPVDTSQPLGDESLVEWARPLLIHALENQEFESLVDPELGKNYVEGEMFRMIEAAAACIRHSAVKRPRMGQVVRALDCLGDPSDLSNGMRPGQSEIFDSAQQSAEIRLFRRMAFGSQNYSSEIFSFGENSQGS